MEAVAVGTIINILTFLASAAILMYGWGVIYENAQRISFRNEVFSRKRALISDIDALTKNSIELWSINEGIPRHNVLQKLELYVIQIESIKNTLKDLRELGLEITYADTIKDFRKNITLSAENLNQLSTDEKSNRISNIVEISNELKGALSIGFRNLFKSYPPS